MKETDFFAILRPKFDQWGTYDRVENSLGSGMSDVHYTIRGVSGWVETKVAKAGKIYFEKFQPNWMRKHIREGQSHIFVCVLDEDKTILLYRSSEIIDVPREVYKKWTVATIADLPEPEVRMPKPHRMWDRILSALIS